MQEIYDLIDKYVKYRYVVIRLNAKLNNLPDDMFDTSVACDYRELGLPDEYVIALEFNSKDLKCLVRVYEELSAQVCSMNSKLYKIIFNLSSEEKGLLFDYLLEKCEQLASEANYYYDGYRRTVDAIEKVGKDSNIKRSLGKSANVLYSKYYELDVIKQSCIYLGCYLSSVVGRNFSDEVKSKNGLSL